MRRSPLALLLGVCACVAFIATGVLGAAAALAAEATVPGQLYGFGLNESGQLGTELGNGGGGGGPLPAAIFLPGSSGPAVELAAGGSHSLAVTSSGQLYSFGANDHGQLGRALGAGSALPEPLPAPVELPGTGSGVVHAAAGRAFSLAVTSTGLLYSFGQNHDGQLGVATNLGSEAPNPTPTHVVLPGAIGPVKQVAAGDRHALALTAGGQVYAFGSNLYGQLGVEANEGTGNPNPIPARVNLPGASGPAVAIAAGADHSLVLTSTGQVYAFGSNLYGQLGVSAGAGTSTPNPTPTSIALGALSGVVVQLAAGAEHSLALTSTGQLLSFGGNRYGQLGRAANAGGTAANPAVLPVLLTGAEAPALQIGAGAGDSLALTATGRLFAFGENRFGELGGLWNLGGEDPNPTPVQPGFPSPTTIDTIAHGGPAASHTLALVADLAVLNGSLPAGQVGAPYATGAVALGGSGTRLWRAEGLPAGLAIDPLSGQISGTPALSGVSNVVLRVSDGFGIGAVSATLPLTIAPPPRARISSTLTEAQIRSSLMKQLGIKGARVRIATLRKRRSYTYGFTALTAGTLAIDWYYLPPGARLARAAPVPFAAGKVDFANAGTKRITLKLSARGRKLLRRRKSIKLSARGSFTPRGKRAIVAATSFKLTR
ncbi:MAG TPA: putative Ig domain-containing protein [Solirubrobacteraceae bacterium]|nr:putative Ig domain-containing protein [Solirubrobacteraceae bacterium]